MFSFGCGEIGCSCSLGAAVFRLFGDTDINIAPGGAIGVECVEKADPDSTSPSGFVPSMAFTAISEIPLFGSRAATIS
jgi:hypothetical protein